jgi:hypothetical protein
VRTDWPVFSKPGSARPYQLPAREKYGIRPMRIRAP